MRGVFRGAELAGGHQLDLVLAPFRGLFAPLVDRLTADSQRLRQLGDTPEMLNHCVGFHGRESRTLDSPMSSTLVAHQARLLDMEDFKARLQLLREHFRQERREFAAWIGVSYKTYCSWESAGHTTKHPAASSVALLQRKTGVSVKWLMDGEGPMFECINEEERGIIELYRKLPKPKQAALRALFDPGSEQEKTGSA